MAVTGQAVLLPAKCGPGVLVPGPRTELRPRFYLTCPKLRLQPAVGRLRRVALNTVPCPPVPYRGLSVRLALLGWRVGGDSGADVVGEVLAGEGRAGGDEVGRGALEDDPAAVVAGTRAEV